MLRWPCFGLHACYACDISATIGTTDTFGSTRAGALALTSYGTPLDCLSVQTREAVLLSWATARLPIFRRLHASLISLVKVFWLRTSPTLGEVLGYPKVPINLNAPASTFAFDFLQIPPPTADEPQVLEADVCIVGSGCGGAVAAKTLAEAGLKVIVVDKAYYWKPEHLPMSENDAAFHLFANGGAHQADDANLSIINGASWGGGGTINWSASLQTQGFVRREWAEKFGLTHFTSSEYQADMDAVCERMGVGTSKIEHNKASAVLLEGARKLGWSAKPVPQNCGSETHSCGYCTLGCGNGGKKGPTESFLPDAANAGAVFIEGFDVETVLFQRDANGSVRSVNGIKGTWTSRDSNGGVSGPDRTMREVIIKAPKVIASAGTLATPLLLQRSGVKNYHIGRHLHLHPVSFVAAVWPEDIKPWEGSILTSVVNEFENLDSEGYGVKLEATTMMPGWFLPVFPWRGGLGWKEFAVKMRRMTGYISLARDRYGGRVCPDPTDGRCRIQYAPKAHDRQHILEGVMRLAELNYVEGAQEIHTAIPSMEPFVRPSSEAGSKIRVASTQKPSSNDVEFRAWLSKLRATGLPSPDTPFASAHQMGTCRMGTDASNSVVDARGKVWGTDGLYVCDTSVFPSASGVNPMITCMGIARGIARGIAEQAGSGDLRARL